MNITSRGNRMNSSLKMMLLASVIGSATFTGTADAVITEHVFAANSVNYCQAFTPGPANTIRNRVIGAENVGSSPIAVACNFHAMLNGSSGSAPPHRIEMAFVNTNASGSFTISCTLLTGGPALGIGYVSTKTTPSMPAGGTAVLTWTAADNPIGGATHLGSPWLGINCTLPQGGLIGETAVAWNQDNGV
jgi:hypothetical protein